MTRCPIDVVRMGPGGWGNERSVAELSVDRPADAVERPAFTVQPECGAGLTLADHAVLGHAVLLVAAQQRIESLVFGAPAVAADAVHDLRNLAHHREHRDDGLVVHL